MQPTCAWLTVAVLYAAMGATAQETPPESRLDEADEAFHTAKKLYELGHYAAAMAQSEHALELRQAALGQAPKVAQCLDLLGVLHQFQGDSTGAEPLLRRALELREATLGQNHPDVAVSLDHLASLYKEQGNHDRALPLYERALAIQEETLGRNHPQLAVVLNNLGRLYSEQGRYDRAEPLYIRALAIQKVALGKTRPEIATTLNNLASLYMSQGRYERAEPFAAQALAIQQASLGSHHPDVATSLNNLALIFARRGDLKMAEQLYKHALAILEETLGWHHPHVGDLLINLAQLRLADDRLDEAIPLLQRAFAISELRLRREALDLSESRITSFMAHLRAQEDLIYELLRVAPEEKAVRHLALTAALLRKGRSVEEVADTSRTAYRRVRPRDREDLARLRASRSQLASLSLQGPGSLMPDDYRQRLKELASQGDELEANLAHRSASLRALAPLPAPEDVVDRVAEFVPQDSALIEFVAYMDRGILHRAGAAQWRPEPQLRYMALVLTWSGSIRVVNLGAAAPIDSAAARMRDALARRDADFQGPAQELYQRVFQPLQKELNGRHRLYLSPDGQLGLVPFAALHDGHQFLVDEYDFIYLTSGKDLLPRPVAVKPSQSVVVLADPDFSVSTPTGSDKPQETAERSVFVDRFFSNLRSDMVSRPWTPLPGTRGEAEAIQRMLPGAQVFLGAEASKERLLHLSAPGVLHVATHGFFLEDTAEQQGTRAVGHFGALGQDALSVPPADPLLRSGLVLAGASASVSDASGGVRRSPESVLVTALELSGLNLWGTQLVVLSACNTGRGDVRLGQGIYGLRRAFIAAGAETVVMSLWNVQDDTTRELMEMYYRLLLSGHGRASALREAMLVLRQTQPHPHYWAPFIAVGRTGSLRVLGTSSQGTPER